MSAIEAGLKSLGLDYGYAAVEGKRVHAGIAYKANSVVLLNGSAAYQAQHLAGYDIVLVECGFEHDFWGARYVVSVDHHNPGDPGYGRPPAEYLQASSIGQVLELVEGWEMVNAASHFGGLDHVRLVAAGDHCPMHAYQGACPGVDPEALKAYRAGNQAAFQRLTPEALLVQVNAACAALEALPTIDIAGTAVANAVGQEIRSLNEASLILNRPVQYSMTDRDGRVKVGLLGGSPATISNWMEAKASELVDIYGDPQRGFAGGYMPQ
jgi:hypothetical protein